MFRSAKIVSFIILDWRHDLCEPPKKKTKSGKKAQFQVFYNELLNSINESPPTEHIAYDDNNLPTDNEGLLREVRESYKSIEDYRHRGMTYYAHLGLVLAKLKFMYFTKCSFCTVKRPEPDLFQTFLVIGVFISVIQVNSSPS